MSAPPAATQPSSPPPSGRGRKEPSQKHGPAGGWPPHGPAILQACWNHRRAPNPSRPRPLVGGVKSRPKSMGRQGVGHTAAPNFIGLRYSRWRAIHFNRLFAWLRRALSSLSGCLYPLCPSAKSFGRRRCVWHLPNETPSFTRSEFLGAESRSKKAPVPKDRNWYCVNKLHQSRSVGTGRDLKRTKQHPLAPALWSGA